METRADVGDDFAPEKIIVCSAKIPFLFPGGRACLKILRRIAGVGPFSTTKKDGRRLRIKSSLQPSPRYWHKRLSGNAFGQNGFGSFITEP